MFQDSFMVWRRISVVNLKGRAVQTVRKIPVMGVVDAASPNDLERLPDYSYAGGAISIVCKFKLFEESRTEAPTQDYFPDLINWAGSIYIVKTLENYSRYGVGWVQAICIEYTYVGTPTQDHAEIPTLDFSNPVNSGYIPCC